MLSSRRPQDDDAMEVVFDDPEPSGAQVVAKVRPVVEEFMTRLAETGRVCSQVRILLRATTGFSEHTWRQPWQFSGDDLLARLSRQLSDLPRGTDEFGADEFCQSGVQAVRIVPTIHRAGKLLKGCLVPGPLSTSSTSSLSCRRGWALRGSWWGGRRWPDAQGSTPTRPLWDGC